jgi:hypothetical protein
VSDFQLILFSEVDRPAREARIPGAFSLIPFRERAELEMAAEKAAERVITVEELASWWTPTEALAYAATCVGSTKAAGNAIWQRLVGGLIETVASTSSVTPKDRTPQPKWTHELVPRSYWKQYSEHGSDFWGAGDVRFFLRLSGTSAVYQAFGVKLNPADVRSTLPPPRPPPKQTWIKKEPEQVAPLAKINKGGRPAKDWWDDFWIDICGQIYEGNLKPRRQADLEKAMLDWATNHRHELSEATARKAAKKLFNAWKLGG